MSYSKHEEPARGRALLDLIDHIKIMNAVLNANCHIISLLPDL
jgi:hypothetical protein